MFLFFLSYVNGKLETKYGKVEITDNIVKNVDSTVRTIDNLTNLAICMLFSSIRKGVLYEIGTCNVYPNHSIRFAGILNSNYTVLGVALITITTTGVIQVMSSVDYSDNIVLNGDVTFCLI